ncbi:SH3 domain-containing YSC84-like protein 1 [Gadus chalcogrammus]|uniref:SH3 domain-containing YSC84-like protein 1 n=1 Tax=Gadus chalcogrammus TaxID=1042646 RepID=UPI0024C346AE|nr:SH3 domain-containing YSC84-like protein 1 [Gadus chalcogrammus]
MLTCSGDIRHGRPRRRYTVTMNNPIPTSLKSETKKAAKILREFTEISSRTGADKLIPAHVIAKAEGLAIITVIKAGFMITARGGSGIVIARLADRRWSAPSAIGIAGLGGGFEIGVEVSDLVIILLQRRAVDAFTKGGNLTLGGNCTVAVGPMGRNVEADVLLRSTAAVFTYCHSRGLFAGISLEGSCLIERKETNQKFYSQVIRASAILNGDVEPPAACHDLYRVLDQYTDAYTDAWTSKHLGPKVPHTYTPTPTPTPGPESTWGPRVLVQDLYRVLDQYTDAYTDAWTSKHLGPKAGPARPRAPSRPPSYCAPPPAKPTLYPSLSVYKPPNAAGGAPGPEGPSGPLVVTATHPFTGQQPGDLSIAPGDRITVVTRTESEYDWWEGRLADGRTGIFPANFVSWS